MGILVVIALETDTATKIVLVMESGVIPVNVLVTEIVLVIALGIIAIFVIEIGIDIESVIEI
jgi:hypothetical protein